MPTVKAKGETHIGRIRPVNQDAFLVNTKEHLFIVADGMGGHAGGEIASKQCIEEIQKHLKGHEQVLRTDVDPGLITNALAHSVNHASSKIYEHALEDPTLRGMGTTATVMKIIDHTVYLAHVGDSRLYLLRQGFLYQMTYDHSLVNEQVRAGIITAEEAEIHHLKNVITRSVGYQEEEDVDTAYFPVEDQDLLVICSDGLHGKVSDKEISKITQKFRCDAVPRLIDLANERGGEDNITVIIVEVQA